MRTGIALVLAVTFGLPGQEPASAAPRVFESEHYRLIAYPPFAEGDDYLRLAEALYTQLAQHFHARPMPKDKLEVRMWQSVEGYRDGGLADGIPAASLASGGIYWTGTSRAYFWRQPSNNFTRHLFLHELTHQFQFLAVMDNQARAPAWYSEGLAEHFGHHRWDGKTLVTGCEDVLGLEQDIPRLAEAGRANQYDITAITDGSAGADKPPSWAAVHFLLAGPDAAARQRFVKIEPQIWSGKLAGAELTKAVLGTDRASANAAANRWLGGLKTTWKIEWIHWDARGADLVGESAVVAIVRSRGEFEHGAAIEATLSEESGSAGLLLAFRSTADFLALYRRPSGQLQLVRRTANAWQAIANAEGPTGASLRLRAEITRGGCVLATSDGKELLRVELGEAAARGAVGLFADAGRTRFSDVVLPADAAR